MQRQPQAMQARLQHSHKIDPYNNYYEYINRYKNSNKPVLLIAYKWFEIYTVPTPDKYFIMIIITSNVGNVVNTYTGIADFDGLLA